MNKFEKVSYNQYIKDRNIDDNNDAIKEYEDIKLPTRATRGSAGYDFFAPFEFTLKMGESIKFPTGISAELDIDKVLICCPKSSLGFKYRMQLDNTIGIVDCDYSQSDNEGHIFAKVTNDGKENKAMHIEKGKAFMQGIILQYFTISSDCVYEKRNGGFGSTGK